MKRNVIVLVVDSLCWRRLGFAGHHPSPSPTIDRLFEGALTLRNCFAAGCPTDFAMVGLLSSSLPLDHGGYQHGLKTRPATIAEVLQKEGYHTALFDSVAYSSDWGNRRGYDEIVRVSDMGTYVADAWNFLRFGRDLLGAAPHLRKEYEAASMQYVRTVLRDMGEACRDSLRLIADRPELRSGMIHDYDFKLLEKAVADAAQALQEHGEACITDLWSERWESNPVGRLFETVRNARHPRTPGPADRAYRRLLIATLGCLYPLSMLGRVAVTARHQARIRLEQGLGGTIIRYPSAGYLVNRLLSWLEQPRSSKPFFAWVHLVDAHELNIASFDVPESDRQVRDELRPQWKLLGSVIRNAAHYRGNCLYDYAVRYVDTQIARLFDRLRTRGRLDDTVVLLLADHGHTHIGFPVRKGVHVTSHFYDELYHTPVGFIGDGIQPASVRGLTSAIDVMPTLLGLLGIAPPPSFQGCDLTRNPGYSRAEVMMENMGSGLADFRAKPILLCVRGPAHKLVYVKPPPCEGKPGYVREFYDLGDDPLELKNLAGRELQAEEGRRLLRLAEARTDRLWRENRVGS